MLVTRETFDQMGYIAMQIGLNAKKQDMSEGERYFRRALAINSSDIEALERLVWIAMLNLNNPELPDHNVNLAKMLAALRGLQAHTLSNPNVSYLWTQYWYERASISRLPRYYEAGFRTSLMAYNYSNPWNYTLLYDPKEMVPSAHFFLMGARGYPVYARGEVFAAKPPINLSRLRLPQPAPEAQDK